jgi:hypothetical protein
MIRIKSTITQNPEHLGRLYAKVAEVLSNTITDELESDFPDGECTGGDLLNAYLTVVANIVRVVAKVRAEQGGIEPNIFKATLIETLTRDKDDWAASLEDLQSGGQ